MAEGGVGVGAGAMSLEVDDARSAVDIDMLMMDLYLFVTKRIDMGVRLEPNGYIDTIGRMELKYISTCLEESIHRATKLGILINLFEKYLLRRLPKAHVEEFRDRDAIKLMVECMVLEPCNGVLDFTVYDLWKLLKTAHTIRSDPSTIMVNKMIFSGRTFTIDAFLTKVFSKISCFGEFLYFCSRQITYENSPLDLTIKNCIQEEIDMIAELQAKITPELGIATYIVYRNWVEDSFPEIKANMDFWINATADKQGFGDLHDAYFQSLEKIDEVELLKDYFKRFLNFLGSEASSAHRYFDLSLLNSGAFLDGMRSKKRFMRLPGINRYLIKVIQSFVDVLMYLHNEVDDSICFKNLPRFFISFWNRSSCPNDYVPSYIFEATQLMNFIFVDQFQNNYSEEYYKICVAIGNSLVDRFDLPQVRETVFKNYCFLPFFGFNDEEQLGFRND